MYNFSDKLYMTTETCIGFSLIYTFTESEGSPIRKLVSNGQKNPSCG
jgi:hypothetical protein